jgi:hypothetical protein
LLKELHGHEFRLSHFLGLAVSARGWNGDVYFIQLGEIVEVRFVGGAFSLSFRVVSEQLIELTLNHKLVLLFKVHY